MAVDATMDIACDTKSNVKIWGLIFLVGLVFILTEIEYFQPSHLYYLIPTSSNLSRNQTTEIPKIVYSLLIQGNEAMLNESNCNTEINPLTKTAFWSWINLNQDWEFKLLTHSVLIDLLPEYSEFFDFFTKHVSYTALSDIIMLSMIHRYGGVYVDADVLCYRPIDQWLYGYLPHNLVSSDKVLAPSMAEDGETFRKKRGPQVSSWFLAGHKDSYIVSKWYNAAIKLWRTRMNNNNTKRDFKYYWVQDLFTKLYHDDYVFKKKWNKLKRLYAVRNGIKVGPSLFTVNIGKTINSEIKKKIATQNPPVLKVHVYAKLNYFANNTIFKYVQDQINYSQPHCLDQFKSVKWPNRWKSIQWQPEH